MSEPKGRVGVRTEERFREPKAPSASGLRSEELAPSDEGRRRLRGAGGERGQQRACAERRGKTEAKGRPEASGEAE